MSKNPDTVPEDPWAYTGQSKPTALFLIHLWLQPMNRTLESLLEGLKPTFWLTISFPPRIYGAHQGRVNMAPNYLVLPSHCSCYLDKQIYFVANSQTGESDTSDEGKYVSIRETFVGNMLTCKEVNERFWIYDMVDFLNIPILRDPNAIHDNFRWVGGDTTV